MQQQNQHQSQIQIIFTHPCIGERKVQASSFQTLSDYRTALDASSELYLFSNYHFQHQGVRLEELEPIEKLFNEKCVKVDIVFNVFEYRTAKFHLYRVMEAIFNPELYLFLTKGSLSEQQIAKLQIEPKELPINLGTLDIENIKPELNHPILFCTSETEKKINLLTSLSLSGFNPAPASDKLNGDLFYIHARSLQGQDLHITASPSGFFLNQSKISCFNPNKSVVFKTVYGSLMDLLKSVSEKFKQNLDKFLTETKLTETIKYKFYSLDKFRKDKWLEFPETEHGWNQRKNTVDEHIKVELLSLKDWNEVFQNQLKTSQQLKLSFVQRAAQLSKIYSEFESAAIEGATCLIDGKISPLNPSDDKKKHIYIYNKIFFSIANETVYDHSQEKGEDATPSSSSINTDLINIEILYNLGITGLHVLHMIVINYRGFKVIAQCIIPGILSVDQMNCSQYGSIDDGKTVETNPEFEEIMVQVCEKLGLEDHIEVTDAENVKKRIAGSPDIKGILGSDKRKYILDLLRLSPRDLNYQGVENETCVIRPELLKLFKKSKETSQYPKINVNIGTDLKFERSANYESQENLLKQIASFLREKSIPNILESLKNHPSQYLTNNEGITRIFHLNGVNMRYLGQVYRNESIKDEVQIKLVLERVIVIRSVKHLLRIAMRQSNIMHLGTTIVNLLNCVFGKTTHLQYLQQGTIDLDDNTDKNADKEAKKKKKKNKNKQPNQVLCEADISQFINVIKIPTNRFVAMKPSEVWEEIRKIALARFSHELVKNQSDLHVFKFPFQKLATLREVCLSVGLVLERKNYDIFDSASVVGLNNDKTLPFSIKNIIDIVPKAKHMKVQPQNLQERQREHEKLIQKYQVKQALRLDSQLEKENIYICGGLNDTAVKLFTRMSRILYILGESKSAISQQEKNLSMLESLHSQDHFLNIQTHLNLGLYYITSNDRNRVIYYMIKGLYLMLVTFGETSPDLLVSLANLARIYQMNKEYKEAIKCYKVAMKFVEQIHGKFHVKMSFCYTSLATISYEMSDLKSAIEHQTENVAILNKILPDTDSKFQDSLKILKMYREMYQKSEIQLNYMNMMLSMDAQKKQEEEKEMKKKAKR